MLCSFKPSQVLLKSPWDFVKRQNSYWISLRWSLLLCISNKLPADVHFSCPWIKFWVGRMLTRILTILMPTYGSHLWFIKIYFWFGMPKIIEFSLISHSVKRRFLEYNAVCDSPLLNATRGHCWPESVSETLYTKQQTHLWIALLFFNWGNSFIHGMLKLERQFWSLVFVGKIISAKQKWFTSVGNQSLLHIYWAPAMWSFALGT